MLSKDISTEFRGRSSQIHVYPLSFSEYHQALGGDERDNFDRYLVYGGLPYLLHLKTEEQYKNYLSNLFDEVYIKDIIERNKIERSDLLQDILNVLSTFISSLTNPLNITNSIKSIKKGKHYFDYPNKYYFTDVGLRNARLGFRQIDSGHIMENINNNPKRYSIALYR